MNIFRENLSHANILDLSEVNADWVNLMVETAQGKNIELNDKNLRLTLDAARYFMMPNLLLQCDLFIIKRGLLKKLVQEWMKEGIEAQELHKDAFANKWLFCERYGLYRNRKILASELIAQLNTLSIKNGSILKDARLLTDDDKQEILAGFNVDEFNNKLKDIIFLQWIWKNVEDLGFLKDLVVKFCADLENKNFVDRAWAIIPKDLDLAIAQLKDAE